MEPASPQEERAVDTGVQVLLEGCCPQVSGQAGLGRGAVSGWIPKEEAET